MLAFSTECETVNCDIVRFLTAGNGSIKDSNGKLGSPSTFEFPNDYKNPVITTSDDGKTMTLKASRAPSTTDTMGKDIKFTCGEEATFTWLINPSGDTGTWNFKLNEDCSVYMAPVPVVVEEVVEEPVGASYIHAAATTIATTAMLVSLF